MLELIDGLPGNVVGIAVSGRLTMQDCQDVLVPAPHGTTSTSGWSTRRAASGLRS